MAEGAEKYRLFVAIHVSDIVKDGLCRMQRELKVVSGESVRWTPPEQLHLTLVFLGNVESPKLTDLEEAFQNVSQEAKSMPLTVEGLGCFPNDRRPRVVWAGINGEVDRLKVFQGRLQEALQPWCEKSESREYRPHLTLGRVREGTRVTKLREALRVNAAVGFGSFVAEGCSLMRSRLSPHGATYTEIRKGRFR